MSCRDGPAGPLADGRAGPAGEATIVLSMNLIDEGSGAVPIMISQAQHGMMPGLPLHTHKESLAHKNLSAPPASPSSRLSVTVGATQDFPIGLLKKDCDYDQ